MRKEKSAAGYTLFSWICSKLEHYALCSQVEIRPVMSLEFLGRLDQKKKKGVNCIFREKGWNQTKEKT